MTQTRRRRLAGGLAAAVLSLAVALTTACSVQGPKGASAVVVVTLDTVRADHLGAYGYPRKTSPRFDSFAESSTLYLRASASAPWTVPTHASLFTGMDPYEHGAVSFYETERPLNVHPLGLEHTTLAELMRDQGFATAAFVANTGYLHQRHQLDQGFETYVVAGVPGVALNREIFSWLDAHALGPFLLFVNYMDSHRPYNNGRLEGAEIPEPDPDGTLLDQLREAVLPGVADAEPQLVERLKTQYDMGIAHADAALGGLLDRLRHLEIDDSTLVVVTSDHGEYLGEHRLAEHSKDVYQEALWVPLAIRSAGQRRGRTEHRPLSSADVPRLIAEGLADPWRSRIADALPPRRATNGVLSENYFTRKNDLANPRWAHRFRRIRRAVVDWPYKYIHSSDGDHELYDLATDPRELDNLIDRESERAQSMAAALSARLADPRLLGLGRLKERPPEDWQSLSEAELRDLRALGYLE